MSLNLTTLISRDKPHFCLMCFKSLKNNNLHEFFHQRINICPDCFSKLVPIRKVAKINGFRGEYLFSYSDYMKEKIYTLKGCGDIELAKAFINYFLFEFKIKYRGYYIVPVPSDSNSDRMRGFNHVIEIFRPLKLPFLPLLYKKVNYKQTTLNKNEREQVINKIGIRDINKIKGKKILLVDDISTTGSTLKAALSLLKCGHPKKLTFIVIAKVKEI